jgi:hypothetical protein
VNLRDLLRQKNNKNRQRINQKNGLYELRITKSMLLWYGELEKMQLYWQLYLVEPGLESGEARVVVRRQCVLLGQVQGVHLQPASTWT